MRQLLSTVLFFYPFLFKEMLSHKEVDAFIRKYNKEVIIKRYSSKRLKDKIVL